MLRSVGQVQAEVRGPAAGPHPDRVPAAPRALPRPLLAAAGRPLPRPGLAQPRQQPRPGPRPRHPALASHRGLGGGGRPRAGCPGPGLVETVSQVRGVTQCYSVLEKFYTDPHLNGYAHPICLYSCHSIPCFKLLEAHFTVSGNKMTITNKILTNQRRPYK